MYVEDPAADTWSLHGLFQDLGLTQTVIYRYSDIETVPVLQGLPTPLALLQCSRT